MAGVWEHAGGSDGRVRALLCPVLNAHSAQLSYGRLPRRGLRLARRHHRHYPCLQVD